MFVRRLLFLGLLIASGLWTETAQAQYGSLPRSITRPLQYWLFDVTIGGNALWRIAAVFGSLLVGFIIGRLARSVLTLLAARAERRHQQFIAVALTSVARAIVLAALAISLRFGLAFLILNESVSSLIFSITSVMIAATIAYAAYCLVDVVDFWVRQISNRTSSRLDNMLAPMIRKSLRATIVIMAVVQIMTILSDKPVTSILAGLGVGGLAIGLAAQDTIKNFFGSLMLFGDRPFEMGDLISVDGLEGNVEVVGFRSTRLRTSEGQVITIPNGDLANKAIRNISRRPFLQRKLTIGLPYDTPVDKVRRAVDVVRDLLANHEGSTAGMPPRVHFNDLTSSTLEIIVMYWYYPADWWKFVEFNERVNYEILRRFRGDDIDFAIPTQELLLATDPRRMLRVDLPGEEEAASDKKPDSRPVAAKEGEGNLTKPRRRKNSDSNSA